jgi:hypothetical protein
MYAARKAKEKSRHNGLQGGGRDLDLEAEGLRWPRGRALKEWSMQDKRGRGLDNEEGRGQREKGRGVYQQRRPRV